MSDVFTKEVWEVVGRKVNYLIDGVGPCGSFISVQPGVSKSQIQIVVGADWKSACANHFNKDSLGELIEILTEIKEAEWN